MDICLTGFSRRSLKFLRHFCVCVDFWGILRKWVRWQMWTHIRCNFASFGLSKLVTLNLVLCIIAAEIIQVSDSIAWVRCASANFWLQSTDAVNRLWESPIKLKLKILWLPWFNGNSQKGKTRLFFFLFLVHNFKNRVHLPLNKSVVDNPDFPLEMGFVYFSKGVSA